MTSSILLIIQKRRIIDMNTPNPCSTCGFLYVDCMYQDDPNYAAECIKNLKMGNLACSSYKYYKQVTQEEKWGMTK